MNSFMERLHEQRALDIDNFLGYGIDKIGVKKETKMAEVSRACVTEAYGGLAGRDANPLQTIHVREINITKLLNGYICRVGCQSVVFETAERMLAELGRYYANPQEVEKEYLKKA